MNREEAHRHKKRKSSGGLGFLLMYRIDAQNVAMKENDLEDTEWLTTKKLRKLKEFTVTTWDKVAEKDDEIVIGAEKKGKAVEIISTSALHALIVGTTGSGKTTGFVDQNIAILGRSKGKPSMIIADPKKELYEKHCTRNTQSNLKARGTKSPRLTSESRILRRGGIPCRCLSAVSVRCVNCKMICKKRTANILPAAKCSCRTAMRGRECRS